MTVLSHLQAHVTYMNDDCHMVHRPPVKVQHSSCENDSTHGINLKVFALDEWIKEECMNA